LVLALPVCRSRPRAAAIPLAILLASARVAYADILPPPTFVADYLWFGLPAGPIVGLALIAGVVFLYRRMRKAGKGRGRAAALGLLLFVAANLLCYLVALGNRRPRDDARLPPASRRVDGSSEQGNPL
jgi:peptidoglycan/LPS O-acetylase OafA/YrhL